MKAAIARFGRLRVVALAVALLPLLLLPVLGTAWLWQSGFILWWTGFALLAGGAGWGLNRLAVAREQAALAEVVTRPGGNWPAEAEACWAEVERFAREATLEQWPLSDGAGLLRLAEEVLRMVARHFHPRAGEPLLEMTLPHTLAVIERVARELRGAVVENVPMSHRVTLGQVGRARRAGEFYRAQQGWLKVVLAVVSPHNIASRELRGLVLERAFQVGSERVQAWLLQEYVLKLGFHAIELYGGLVRLDEAVPLAAADARLAADDRAAAANELALAEPLRIVLLGRSNAGKSSLVNALFGELRAATDPLHDTTAGVMPYRLEFDESLRALVFDTPGIDAPPAMTRAVQAAAAAADLVLWVTAADRPDRAAERAWLDRLRASQRDAKRRAPPLLVAMSGIDRLRPPREWSPPYRLDPPEGTKAGHIAAAAAAVATDLAVPPEAVVPVCLAEGRHYNVEDALWAAMLMAQPEAQRVRLLRCVRARRREEDWALLWRQLAKAGRVLVKLPGLVRPG